MASCRGPPRCEERSPLSIPTEGFQEISSSNWLVSDIVPLTEQCPEYDTSAIVEALPKRSTCSSEKVDESARDCRSIIAAREGVDGEGSGKFTSDTSIFDSGMEMPLRAEMEEVTCPTFSCASFIMCPGPALSTKKLPDTICQSIKKPQNEVQKKTAAAGLGSMEGDQHISKTARTSKRVFPETVQPTEMVREHAAQVSRVVVVVASPRRSRRLAQKAEEKLGASAGDGSSIIAASKGVDGEGSGKFSSGTTICGSGMETGSCFGKDNIQDQHLTPSGESVDAGEEGRSRTCSCLSCLKRLRTALGKVGSSGLSWLFKKHRNGSAKREEARKKPTVTGLESLPLDIRERIFWRLSFKELFLSKILSKSCKNLVGSDAFLRSRGTSGEGSFTAINFFMKNNAWQCTGLDLQSNTWRRLPTFSCLPVPDTSLFKEYSICGHGALMCANVSKLPRKGELVVFNILTGETRKLPSLHYPRNPVLVHILVDSETNAYKVIAAGSSSSSGEENLSRRVEVFDSLTSQWAVASDLPGPEFGLNEHQTGVCVDGMLYFVASLEGDGRRSVVAYDMEKGGWVKDRSCPVPFSLNSNILQLVECDGMVYLFSEQERGGAVEHCIDKLEFSGVNGEVACRLKNLVAGEDVGRGDRGLLLLAVISAAIGGGVREDQSFNFPEHTCVPYGRGKLCIFNTIKRNGVVYDADNGNKIELLQSPPGSLGGDAFFSLNPVAFTLQPNFSIKP